LLSARDRSLLLRDAQLVIANEPTLNDRAEFITALLDVDHAIRRRQATPPSQAIGFAFTCAKTHLVLDQIARPSPLMCAPA